MSVSNMFDLESDNGMRRLCYLTAFIVVVFSLLQALFASWPLGFNNVRWRLGATNNFVQNLHLVLLGLVMMLAIARSVADKSMSRVVGAVGALATLFLLIGAGLFLLDSVQLKAIISDKDMPAYKLAIVRVGVTLTMYLVGFAVLTLVAFKPPFAKDKVITKGTKRVADDEPTGFLIGQDYTK